jgi:hypothetical protein
MLATPKSSAKSHRNSLIGLEANPIISVKEARKLLGKQFNYLTDDEVQRMVALLDNIARGFIQSKVPQY